MKKYANRFVVLFCLMAVLGGCKKQTNGSHHAKSLQIDSRYKQEIEFDIIGIKIPIKQDDVFIRIDGAVSNVDEHQAELFKELGVVSGNIMYSNPATGGRQMYLSFGDGKKCSFIWVLENPEDLIELASIEHEKYHALCRISPSDISLVSERVKEVGFNIDLQGYDEELAATIVQILSIHLSGIELDEISGLELTVQARDILKASSIESTSVADSDRPDN